MSAEILREAAKVLRERAQKATPGPWEHIPAGAWTGRVFGGFGGEDLVAKTSTAAPDEHGNAVYIATVDPDFGLAVADWLDRAAWAEDVSGFKPKGGYKDHALTVARLILGGAS